MAWFHQRSLTKRILQELRIDVVLDVGANEGQFGEEIRKIWSGELHSFEPVPGSFRALERRAAGDEHWHVHRFALGDRDHTATIRVSKLPVFSSLLPTNDFCAERFGSDATDVHEESIDVRRLDAVLPTIIPQAAGKRFFLKMDTQGYDLNVFRGLGGFLPRIVGMQSAISHLPIYDGMSHWTECLQEFEQAGFEVAGLFPVNWDDLSVVEHDCVLVRSRARTRQEADPRTDGAPRPTADMAD